MWNNGIRFLPSVLLIAGMLLRATESKSDACLDCTDWCSILPPSGDAFPCYQGTPEDANLCYDSDPALVADSTYYCATCLSFGYLYYKKNDPVYTNMELWVKNISNAVSQAPTAVPSIMPTLVPTLRPTTRPTALDPTASPTLYPTAQPSAQSSPIVTFQSMLTLVGSNGAALDAASQATLINVTASTMGISTSTVTYQGAVALVSNSVRSYAMRAKSAKGALDTVTSFQAVTQVSVPLASTGYTNATLYYITLTTALANSVNAGTFTQQLNTMAVVFGSSELLNVNVTSVSSTPLVVESYDGDGNDDDDSNYSPMIVGIVAGGVVLLIILYVLLGRRWLMPAPLPERDPGAVVVINPARVRGV